MERQAPYKLTQTEQADLPAKIQAILKNHSGAQHAITGLKIARLLGYRSDRKIRVVIQSLIASGHAIAASVGQPVGYYLIETPGEARAYAAVLRSRAVHTFKRMREFEMAAQLVFAIPPEPFQPTLFSIDTAEAMRQADDNEMW